MRWLGHLHALHRTTGHMAGKVKIELFSKWIKSGQVRSGTGHEQRGLQVRTTSCERCLLVTGVPRSIVQRLKLTQKALLKKNENVRKAHKQFAGSPTRTLTSTTHCVRVINLSAATETPLLLPQERLTAKILFPAKSLWSDHCWLILSPLSDPCLTKWGACPHSKTS